MKVRGLGWGRLFLKTADQAVITRWARVTNTNPKPTGESEINSRCF